MSSTSVNSNGPLIEDQALLIPLANSCRILADCFWEPRLPSDQTWDLLLEASSNISPEAHSWVIKAKKGAAGLNQDELPVHFAQYFVGPFEILCPPYASYYLDDREAFAGRTQSRLVTFYQRGGLGLPPRAGETPDHFSVEMEFLYYLYAKAIQTNQASLVQLADQFAANELVSWLPAFSEGLKNKTKFYYCLSRYAEIVAERAQCV